ncbi:MAG: 3-methyl-2-oxobutanoate hydroxymethyltransferase [Lentisphaerae bacterium]|nr:MAG: 3-methyl-2-oxobutanoate hydroxymethyltransferase [Lentisphaerota bacterium]
MADGKITVRDLKRKHRRNEKIVCITAYDALFANLFDQCDVDLILVGDSMGMVILGYPSTIQVTLEQSLHHTAAVVRGTNRAMVVGDMPFLSYQESPQQALRNAGRYLQEAGADAVKLEGGTEMAPTVERLVQAGIPVLGHIGLLPQHIAVEGKIRGYGRTEKEAEKLLADARALEQAGAFAIVLEATAIEVTRRISEEISIPTIGIGAGPYCSGQIQVCHDILGLFEKFKPRHARQYAQLAGLVRQAVSEYVQEVRQGQFPTEEHSFHQPSSQS